MHQYLLRKNLIALYEDYVSEIPKRKKAAIEHAKHLSALWTRQAKYDPHIDTAINYLRYFCNEPELPRRKALDILFSLKG